MKKLVFTLLLSLPATYAWAQAAQENAQHGQEAAGVLPEVKHDTTEKHANQQRAGAPQLSNYGSLMVDLGMSILPYHHPAMALNYLGARFSSGSIYYNIRLGGSHFTINPGVGLSANYYMSRDKDNILVRDQTSRNTTFAKAHERFPGSTKITRSALNMRYVDLMLDARFNANSKYPKTSFFAAVGGKLCYLWSAATTIAYQEDDATKKQTNLEGFNLNKTRGGLYIRLGWGRFGLCYTHMLSNLFQQDKGPDNNTTKTSSISLSVDLL